MDVLEWFNKSWPLFLVSAIFVLIVMAVCIAWCIWKYKTKHRRHKDGYSSIDDQVPLPEKLLIDQQKQEKSIKERTLMACQYYLRNVNHYSDVQQLDEIGRRDEKYWFLVHDSLVGRKTLLSAIKYDPKMALPFSQESEADLRIFDQYIKHPYIMPFIHIEFLLEDDAIVVSRPFSPSGSLKDEIYQSRCLDDHRDKYNHNGQPLPLGQIQTYSSQILKALLHMQQKKLPVFSHLHSGNVILFNGTCRLTDTENIFFQKHYLLSPLFRKKLTDAPDNSLSILMFGHLLFEMSTGMELEDTYPRVDEMTCCVYPAVTNVLDFIFNNKSTQYPTLEELSNLSFFREVPHPALKGYRPSREPLPQNLKEHLRILRKGISQKSSIGRKTKRKRSSLTNMDLFMKSPQFQTNQAQTEELFTPVSPLPPPPKTPPPIEVVHKAPPATPPPPPPPLLPSPLRQLLPSKSSPSETGRHVVPKRQASLPTSLLQSTTGSERSQTVAPNRAVLLSDIEKGTKLKKTKVNDRSSPKL
ncbi:slowpoke-binding protein [Octopus bimaculoides]|nr:slowpoke-binding protein [Octopus bimaculoides]